MSLEVHIEKAAAGEGLSTDEAEAAFGQIVEGKATPVQITAMLVALRSRGANPQEVAGGVRALRRAMVRLPVDVDGAVDTCGTGGGSLTTFNISTVAGLVTAAAGVPVAKHGNRSYSSRCGSADVLEAAGVEIELSVERLSAVFREADFVFMYAPAFHPAMRHVAEVRDQLGFATIFNVLGPLTNPAGVRRQVVGVGDPGLLQLVADALGELAHERALVVHGQPGLDELSPLGPTRALHVEDGAVEPLTIRPERFGWSALDPRGLAGGSPEENLSLMEAVLRGRGSREAEAAVALNAGAAIWMGDGAGSLEEGVERAREVISSGRGWEKLEEVRSATGGT